MKWFNLTNNDVGCIAPLRRILPFTKYIDKDEAEFVTKCSHNVLCVDCVPFKVQIRCFLVMEMFSKDRNVLTHYFHTWK